MTSNPAAPSDAPAIGWRFKLGIALFILAFLPWVLVPIGASIGVEAGRMAALTGVIFVFNKVLLLVVIAVMGKAGFKQLRGMLFGYVKSMAPEPQVGPVRYRIGLVMFCVPIVSAWLESYFDAALPGWRPNLWQLQLLGDAMLVASFFVLGADFWGKVRALFVRTARVVDDGDRAAA